MKLGRDIAAASAHPTPVGAAETFVSIVSQLGLLSTEEATRVSTAAMQEQIPPCRYAVQHGVIQPADADIVDTLLHPTEMIPGYEILGLIGRGGMGVVYRARQKSLNRPVALKSISLNQLSNPTVARRFELEAQTLARLAHPHIVSAFDFGRHADRLYLAMELIEGEDVERLIQRRGALPESLVWVLLRQAAAGLAHAARAGFVHRDVKPANLLLVPPPEGFALPAGVPLVKVADFGLALLTADAQDHSPNRLTSAHVHVGSPVYMAPEQLESGVVDQRADIFSLGATAWHMLAGYPPLNGKSLREIITLRLSKPTDSIVQHNPQVSAASAELLAAMLQPDPARRLGEYDQLLSAIERLIAQAKSTPDIAATLVLPRTTVTLPVAGPTDVTAELPASILSRPRITRRMVAASCAVVGLLLVVGLWLAPRNSVPSDREFIGDGRPVALFDGRTLTGWKILGGAWKPSLDDEGGRVLMGTDGLISRTINSEYQHFQFEVYVNRGDAQSVEIQFDFAPENSERLVVRVSTDEMTIGRRGGDRGEFNTSYPLSTTAKLNGRGLTLRLERQRRDWHVMLDGEDVAIIPACHAISSREIRLRVDQGTAQFADVLLEPLIPKR